MDKENKIDLKLIEKVVENLNNNGTTIFNGGIFVTNDNRLFNIVIKLEEIKKNYKGISKANTEASIYNLFNKVKSEVAN